RARTRDSPAPFEPGRHGCAATDEADFHGWHHNGASDRALASARSLPPVFPRRLADAALPRRAGESPAVLRPRLLQTLTGQAPEQKRKKRERGENRSQTPRRPSGKRRASPQKPPLNPCRRSL